MSNSTSFKSQSASERSGDILVSFSSRWIDRIRGKSPKYIFRRRVPKLFVPKRVFVYVASPLSEIVGYFTVKSLKQVTLSEALKLSTESQVSVSELNAYFSGYDTVGCYFVQSTAIFNDPIRLSELRENFNFFPPQSFVALSDFASDWIDRKLGGPSLQGFSSTQVDGTLRSGADESKV